MTIAHKDFRGAWRAEDRYDLGNNQQLSITTHKTHSGAIVTHASVGRVEGDFVSHTVYQDFSKHLKVSNIRCTQKNVEAQHAAAVATLDQIKEAVAHHYRSEEIAA